MKILFFFVLIAVGAYALGIAVRLMFANSARYREAHELTASLRNALAGNVILEYGDERAQRGLSIDSKARRVIDQGAVSTSAIRRASTSAD